MSENTLNQCYPDGIIGNGIFTDLQKLDVPWKSKNINKSLDIAYYGKNSGQKIASPLIDNFTADDTPVISDVNRAIIAKCLFDVYGENWKHLWDTTQQEYNMLWNTDATIEVDTTNSGKDSRTSSGTDSGTDTHILSGTDTTTKDLTDTHTLGGSDTDATTKDLTDTHTLGGTDTDATTKDLTDTHTLGGSDTDATTKDLTDTHTLGGTDTDATTKDLTDTHTLGGKDTDTLTTKGTNTDKETGTDKNKGNDVTYHHQKTIQFHPADKNTSTVTNKTAGYNGSDFANDTQQTTVDNTAVLTHTYTDNSDKNPYVDAKGKDDAWKNSDETDSERTETRDLTTTHELNETDTTTHSYGKTDAETIKGTDTATHSYGKTDTETIKGTDTATTYGRTDSETMSNTNSSTENGTNDFTGKETTRRTGNIGVTSNQQMIQAERDLWKWNFFSQIFTDIDRYLTLAVY